MCLLAAETDGREKAQEAVGRREAMGRREASGERRVARGERLEARGEICDGVIKTWVTEGGVRLSVMGHRLWVKRPDRCGCG